MSKQPPLTAETYATIDELVRLGSIAVTRAQNDSRRLGVPNVYAINGRIYYETSSGELSLTHPYLTGEEAAGETIQSADVDDAS